MKRSAGVTVIAVLSLLGSLFALLMGLLVASVPFLASKLGEKNSPFDPGTFKVIMILAAFVYLGPAVWGICSSIGLFRLKEWARISTIVFAVLLILMSGFGGLMMVLVPLPTTPNSSADASIQAWVRLFMGMVSLALVSLGVWWTVFLTRRKAKEQFVPPQVAGTDGTVLSNGGVPSLANAVLPLSSAPRRPLSLTILAWFLLVGCLFAPFSIFLHAPVMLFNRILTGWQGTAYLVIFAALNLYVGIGLLRFKPSARSVGVVYYGFFFVNMAVFYLAPGGRSRMLELLQRSQSMNRWMPPMADQQLALYQSKPFLVWMACMGLVGILVPLYLLVTRRQAFEAAAAAHLQSSA